MTRRSQWDLLTRDELISRLNQYVEEQHRLAEAEAILRLAVEAFPPRVTPCADGNCWVCRADKLLATAGRSNK